MLKINTKKAKKYLKKYKSQNKVKDFVPLIILGCFLVVVLTSVGYAAFNNTFSINPVHLTIRPEQDIRVTNVYNGDLSLDGVINNLDYNKDRIITNITLPTEQSEVKLRVKITNIGNQVMGILNIQGLPTNLKYRTEDYKIKERICNSSGICTGGIDKEFNIVIYYDTFDSSNTTYNFDIIFDFRPVYTVTYTNIDTYTGMEGSIVYYDVAEGTGCTESEYRQSYNSKLNDYENSNVGYNGFNSTASNQNSCLKFYVVKDDTNTADLILDHNTTQTCYWRSADDTSVQGGPIDVIQKVKRDTENWQGVLTPDNYTLNGVTNTYTIDYSNSNARIITAQEIADLTENYWFDEKKTKYAERFSFDNNGVDFNTILRGDNSVSTWGWVYDRVWKTCVNGGCLHNANGITEPSAWSYWTATSIANTSNLAWMVHSNGIIEGNYHNNNEKSGVRPVIKVNKSKITMNNSILVFGGNAYRPKLGNYPPYSISVTMNGSNYTGYTYDSSTGKLTIPNITGNIVITANEYNEGILNGGTPKYNLANLTPVYYDGTHWRAASKYQKWYSYNELKWANAVNLKSGVTKKVGQFVDIDGATTNEINGTWVWIPKFEYKIEGNYGKGGTSTSSPGEIEVNFISKSTTTPTDGYHVHPAFTFGDSNVSGVWIGKFETSHTTLSGSSSSNNLGCSNTNCTNADGLRVVPNVKAIKYNNVSNFFYASRSMNRSGNPFGFDQSKVDSHMVKNSEWGAPAYLSQSKYGKYGNSNYSGANKEIYINNSNAAVTGRSAGKPGTSSGSYNAEGTYTYEIESSGTGASTTGNIYGIYDMSGGASEYAMTVMSKSAMLSGFSSFPDSKYYDNYGGISLVADNACDGDICYGHAYTETKDWYGDYSNAVLRLLPWVIRGGNGTGISMGSGTYAGPFFYGAVDGAADNNYSFRSILTPVE